MPRFFILLVALLLAGFSLAQWQYAPAGSSAKNSASQPIPNDLTALKDRYLGQTVWLYGGGPVSCVTSRYNKSTLLGTPHSPLRIVNVAYAQQPLSVSISDTGVFQPRQVKQALLITFRLRTDFKVNSSFGGNKPIEAPELVTSKV